jgi:hypothetical protein
VSSKHALQRIQHLVHNIDVMDACCAGELLFGFIEENANRADTAGGRFINATVATGQSFFIPQGPH